jgi:hypothetical protein
MITTTEPREPTCATTVVAAEAEGAAEMLDAVSTSSPAQASATAAAIREGGQVIIVAIPSGFQTGLAGSAPYPFTYQAL